jgi:hypothetical protein
MFFGPAALSVWILVRGIDIFAAVLGLAGISLVSEEGGRWKCRIVAATAILVIAFFAKQTTIFPAAAAILYVISRKPKWGAAMCAGYGLMTLLFIGLIQIISKGWFFENVFLTIGSNPFFPKQFLQFFGTFCLALFVAFPVAFAQAIRGIDRKPHIWTLYFLFTVLSALLAGKFGAALSYFVPLFSAVCINVGLWLGTRFGRRSLLWTVTAILLLLQALSFFPNQIAVPTEHDRWWAEELDHRIQKHSGPILIERIDSFAVRNGRELNVEAVQLPYLVMRGEFDPNLLIAAIENKEFSLIIYSGYHFGWIPGLERAIFDHYEVTDKIKIGLFYEKTLFSVLVPQ